MSTTQSQIAHLPIRDCMSVFLISIGPFETVARAFEIMSVNHIRHLPIIEDGNLLGIVSWSDVLEVRPSDPANRLDLEGVTAELARLTVSSVMTRELITVHPNQPLGHAAELMLEHKIGALPVLDTEQKVVGLVTESNIFRKIARCWREDNELFSGAHHP